MESKLHKILYLEPIEKDVDREVFHTVAKCRLGFYNILTQRKEQLQKMIFSPDEAKDWKSIFKDYVKDEKDFNFYLIDGETADPEGRYSSQQVRERDNFSHFICRMMYCLDEVKRDQFCIFQQTILKLRLGQLKNNQLRIERANNNRKPQYNYTRKAYFSLIKVLELQVYGTELIQQITYEEFIREENTQFGKCKLNERIFAGLKFSQKYDLEELKYTDIFKVPIKYSPHIANRRECYIAGGWAYVDFNLLLEMIPRVYEKYLRQKLINLEVEVRIMLSEDTDNQFRALIKQGPASVITGEVNIEDLKDKLNLKNMPVLSKRSFPPCMLNLLQALESIKHLKHEGRRQLMLFLKGAGLTMEQSLEFWKRNLTKGVSDSQAKQHQYNVRHSYGRQGQKKDYTPKICSTIIKDPAPKANQHHGCLFKHHGKQHIKKFLTQKYLLNANDINEILVLKEGNHYQLACKTLFNKSHPDPENKLSEITMKVGNSPNVYYHSSQKYYELINNVPKQ